MSKKKPTMNMEDFRKEFNDIIIPIDKLVRTDKQLIRTGSLKIDLMLRGGFRAGTISELYGPEGGGKTTIALEAAKRVLDEGGAVFWIDLERSLDAGVDFEDHGHLGGWMEIIGIDPHHENLVVSRISSGEDVYTVIEKVIQSGLFDLLVLDSMAGMVPLAELEGDVNISAFGKLANLNSSALKRILRKFDTQKIERTHWMVINQARDNVGSPHGGMKSPGGRALKHFARTKLRCTRVGKKEIGGHMVNTVRLRVDKNGFSPAWEECEIFIHPLYGIDNTMDLIEYGVKEGFIEKGGAWYTITDPITGEELGKVQGSEKLRQLIVGTEGLADKLHTMIWESGIDRFISQQKS